MLKQRLNDPVSAFGRHHGLHRNSSVLPVNGPEFVQTHIHHDVDVKRLGRDGMDEFDQSSALKVLSNERALGVALMDREIVDPLREVEVYLAEIGFQPVFA